ncbi:hypothetical protein C8Q73DRAFT_437266 [Cubamyces lactineus]|nr:hypothetical protein C8Q73DRAFT_437266 [Cubamyces lactineus]
MQPNLCPFWWRRKTLPAPGGSQSFNFTATVSTANFPRVMKALVASRPCAGLPAPLRCPTRLNHHGRATVTKSSVVHRHSSRTLYIRGDPLEGWKPGGWRRYGTTHTVPCMHRLVNVTECVSVTVNDSKRSFQNHVQVGIVCVRRIAASILENGGKRWIYWMAGGRYAGWYRGVKYKWVSTVPASTNGSRVNGPCSTSQTHALKESNCALLA